MISKKDFKKINDYLWEIPKTLRPDMRVPARVYVSEKMLDEVFRDDSIPQLINGTTLPGIVKYGIAMPDCHEGYSVPIGFVGAIRTSDGIISPGACGGGRDKWKRPILGELAGKYCDKVIVTNEDPYDEDPTAIINQVADGTAGKAEKILNRREAIKKALSLAKPGETVVITGKGCEPWICLANGKKIPWDDRQVVKEEFEKLKQ